ncbi:MAG: hemolysin III family protein, partial [Planctomycetes bacterium]|nr:hemolysin III family protein [Planctomycetota bacterium]
MPSSASAADLNPVSGQSALEEVVNSLTHGLGVLFGVVATVFLVAYSALREDPALVVACAIFGGSVILLYASSALYHGVRGVTWKRRLQVADHVAIYLLIAGTYTPFALGPTRGGPGPLMLLAALPRA